MNDEILNDTADNLRQYLWNKSQLYMLAHKETLCDIRLGRYSGSIKNIGQLIGDMMKDIVINEWKYGDYFDAFVDVKDISIGDKADFKTGHLYIDEFREQQGGGLYLYGANKIRNHCAAKQDS
jgi:hypothetical protein